MIVNSLKDFIEAVRGLSGYRLIFRPNNPDLFKTKTDLTNHQGPVCRALKISLHEKCDTDCVKNTEKQALNSNKPFLKLCHAGVYELVVPVISPSGCEGFFFLGPAKMQKKFNVYKNLSKEYSQLPEHNKTIFNNTEKLLKIFADYLFIEIEKMSINEISNSSENDRIKTAISYINKNMKKRIKGYELAKECGLSVWYFLHLFKRTTGVPVSIYIKKVKLERAKTFLASTNMKISSIIEETGYMNENSFFIAFKKYTGVTPNNYRNNAAKNSI
jgi:AraC-like DNA-binding protein